MARKHGRAGRLYLDLTGAGSAESVAFLKKWSLKATTDKTDVTSFDDSNKTYLPGLPDATGEFEGYHDDATAQTYTAATDGTARKFYLYVDKTVSGKYFFGTAFFDYEIETPVDGPVTIKGSWNAATVVSKVG